MSVYQSYQLYEIIGHSASCTVKRAIRKDTRETFAAKICETNFLSAKNEVQMLVQLDHPNIVNIYEVFQEDQCIILILEFMEGGELYQSVGQRSSFTEAQVKEYMKILVDTIRYCHEMKVVHRDIKPENLLMSKSGPEGILKLADFGISKILSEEMLTTHCGTPIYMAPQIFQGHDYGTKVDIWSIGVVMYYLLSGMHPFNGDLEDIPEKIMTEELSFSSPIWNLISSKGISSQNTAIDFVRKMLQKDPKNRPTAIQLTQHIWFSEIEQIQSPKSDTKTQISLFSTVSKINRGIHKNKMKKNRNKLKNLSEAQSCLSETRLQFLTSFQNASPYTQISQSMDIQMETP